MSNIEEFRGARRPTEYEALLIAAPGILDAIPGAVYVCDRDGYLVCHNTEAVQLWERTPTLNGRRDRFCGSHRLFRRDGTPLSHDDYPLAQTIRTGNEARNVEVAIERPSGSRIVALANTRVLRDFQGNVQGAIGCLQDVSEREALADENRRRSADLDDFFENSAIGLHIVSGEGIIQRANRAELDMLGYTAEEYIGRHIAEFHVDASVIGDILHKLSCEGKIERYPASLRAKDGSIRRVLITSDSRFHDGKFINTRCFTTDVTGLHEADDARRESEERLAATYQAATIGIAETDQQGNLLRVNDALCNMLGRSREELLTMTFFDFTHEDDRNEDAALYARLIRGEVDKYRYRKRASAADGKSIYLDIYCSSVRNSVGGFRYGVRIIQDVTKNKVAEDRLRESETRMRDVLEALPAAVYTTDASGRITYYNKAAVEMAGRTPSPGDEWCVTWRLYNPDGTPLPHDQCPMAVALKQNRPVRGVEAVAERPDGTRVPFIPYPTPLHDSSGKLVGAINMLVDISERKKAEDYAGRLASIVEFSDDAIISKDTNGIIRTWNKSAQRLFGYEASEVIGKPVSILIPPDRQDEEPSILKRIRQGEHIDHYETVRMRKDGTFLNISLTVSPLKDATGRVIGASKIARDITERRRQEERRQLLVNELNHRVKNTLVTVQSIAAQTFRGKVQSSVFSQFDSRLVALSRAHDVLTRESWGHVDLKELIEQTISPFSGDYGRRIEVSGAVLRLKPKYALSLSMALHELCTNAVKYGALANDFGQVKIEWEVVEDDDQERDLRLRWEETGGPVVNAPLKKGFGSRLLERVLCHELGALVQLTFLPTGVICEIEARLSK